jgi:hypothetical protein
LLKRKLVEKESNNTKINKVHEVCDFYQKDHPNGHCIPKGSSEEAKYMGNYQKSNPYSNNYNPRWKDHPNSNGICNSRILINRIFV